MFCFVFLLGESYLQVGLVAPVRAEHAEMGQELRLGVCRPTVIRLML